MCNSIQSDLRANRKETNYFSFANEPGTDSSVNTVPLIGGYPLTGLMSLFRTAIFVLVVRCDLAQKLLSLLKTLRFFILGHSAPEPLR